jgi:hypothetical protein
MGEKRPMRDKEIRQGNLLQLLEQTLEFVSVFEEASRKSRLKI